MNQFRFSPIKSQKELIKAIEHVHFSCFKLCKRYFGRYLPVSGNLGIFCHFPDEFEYLTKLREELADKNVNWNKKYFLLHKPITIKAQYGDIPDTTYTYLYIRRPDEDKPQVGDIDLVLEKDEFGKLKDQVVEKKVVNGVELFYRPDLNMIRLATPDIDVLPYITTKYMTENVSL
jgi:hypothetical protein